MIVSDLKNYNFNGVAAVFGLHAAFAMLFVASAMLFRKAAHLPFIFSALPVFLTS